MSFTRSLQVEALPDGKHWMVLRSFAWVENGKEYFVPSNFVTDFGSIPNLFVPLAGGADDQAQGFVLHDKLYRDPEGLTRSECDAILDRALKWLGRGYFSRLAVKAGLFVGGWAAWNHYRALDSLHFDP